MPIDLKRATLTVVFVLSTIVVLSADNWPQWRGPHHTGVSAEKGLPVKWATATGDNIAWKLAMPSRSGATPIIWNDMIFLNVATAPGGTPEAPVGELELWAVDRATGTMKWKKSLADRNYMQRKQNMSSPSPVTDGKTVWVMTGVGILKAFDFTGKELWTRDIQKDYGAFGLNWGYASSPLLHEGMLYVQVLHGMKTDDPSYVMKIDGTSGKTLWKVERPTDALQESPDSYTTPALLQYEKTKEIVITGGDVVTGHDLETGKELWRAAGLNPDKARNYRIVASPIVVGSIVVAPTRVRPMVAIKPGGRGDITASHTAWTFDRGPDVPTPVSDGKLLYTVNDGGIIHALDVQTGAVVYGPERLKAAIYSASPTLADGKIYVTSEEGLTSVFSAGPKFELLAENDSAEYTLSTISVSQGQLFLRTEKALYAIGKK